MNNDLFVGMVESMGGNATPMAFAEVYQSLKTGVVDGAENNPPSYESTNHFEVAPYYSLTEHLIIPECVCMSSRSFDALSEEQQAIVRTAARNSADAQRLLWQEREKVSMETVAAGGVEVNTIEDKTPFQEAMAPVYDQFLAGNPDLADLVQLMRDAEYARTPASSTAHDCYSRTLRLRRKKTGAVVSGWLVNVVSADLIGEERRMLAARVVEHVDDARQVPTDQRDGMLLPACSDAVVQLRVIVVDLLHLVCVRQAQQAHPIQL